MFWIIVFALFLNLNCCAAQGSEGSSSQAVTKITVGQARLFTTALQLLDRANSKDFFESHMKSKQLQSPIKLEYKSEQNTFTLIADAFKKQYSPLKLEKENDWDNEDSDYITHIITSLCFEREKQKRPIHKLSDTNHDINNCIGQAFAYNDHVDAQQNAAKWSRWAYLSIPGVTLFMNCLSWSYFYYCQKYSKKMALWPLLVSVGGSVGILAFCWLKKLRSDVRVMETTVNLQQYTQKQMMSGLAPIINMQEVIMDCMLGGYGKKITVDEIVQKFNQGPHKEALDNTIQNYINNGECLEVNVQKKNNANMGGSSFEQTMTSVMKSMSPSFFKSMMQTTVTVLQENRDELLGSINQGNMLPASTKESGPVEEPIDD